MLPHLTGKCKKVIFNNTEQHSPTNFWNIEISITCIIDDTIFSYLIIVLTYINDPLLFVHYLNLFSLFNCIELLTSYAMSLFCCMFVASILKVTYRPSFFCDSELWYFTASATVSVQSSLILPELQQQMVQR